MNRRSLFGALAGLLAAPAAKAAPTLRAFTDAGTFIVPTASAASAGGTGGFSPTLHQRLLGAGESITIRILGEADVGGIARGFRLPTRTTAPRAPTRLGSRASGLPAHWPEASTHEAMRGAE